MTKFKYEIIIYWSSIDDRYIAEVPELQGCMSDGLSYAEALNNAEIIITEWLETAKSLGLLPEEFEKIKSILGRTPNFT